MMPSTCLASRRGDDVPLALRVVAHVAEEDEDLGGAERVLDPGDDRHVEAPEVVGRDQPDREGAAAQQTLDQVVGAELEPLRLADAPARASRRGGGPCPFSALEAVPTETPAARATSRIVGRRGRCFAVGLVTEHARAPSLEEIERCSGRPLPIAALVSMVPDAAPAPSGAFCRFL